MTTQGKVLCAICQTSLEDDQARTACPGCASTYHPPCWEANGGCATYGCGNAPQPPEADSRGPGQMTSWGAMEKTCPMCGERINVSETKCPFCRTDFGTAQPITREDVRARFSSATAQNALKKYAVAIMLVSLLGVTGPFNLLIGGAWYAVKRRELKRRCPLHGLLAKIGLCISAVYTLLIVVGLAR